MATQHVVTGLFIGPMFGAAWGGLLWAIAWFIEHPVPFLPCYAAGWLLSTVTFAYDLRTWFFPAELELEAVEVTDERPPGPPAFQG